MNTFLCVKRINSLADALAVAAIRNDCRSWLTNHTGYISPLVQARWWHRVYSRPENDRYVLWLARTTEGQPCAYAALSYQTDGGYLTVCVSPAFRQQGLGGRLIEFLATQAVPANVAPKLIAVIREDNVNSLGLHEKWGFTKCGLESPGLLRYELALDRA